LLIVIGLGNPGETYDGTRHNIGKEAVSELAQSMDLQFEPGRGKFFFARDTSHDLILVVPTTYMNHSGRSAVETLDFFGSGSGGLLAVCDDFNLPLGTIRIRSKGSDGGHNGLASIIFQLESQDFPRLRMGIGPVPLGEEASDFVLSRFRDEEMELVAKLKQTACAAILAIAGRGIDRAMTEFNKHLEQ
jgi:PTH1 family peptidyl-tRNA hydrolase